jgi:threonine/homoserine/homoserine lactone efflux protein
VTPFERRLRRRNRILGVARRAVLSALGLSIVLASARARRSLEAVSGTVLLGFGVRLAFEDRR